MIKALSLPVTGTQVLNAQVTAGGIQRETLIRERSNLVRYPAFAAGEALDIDGDTGI